MSAGSVSSIVNVRGHFLVKIEDEDLLALLSAAEEEAAAAFAELGLLLEAPGAGAAAEASAKICDPGAWGAADAALLPEGASMDKDPAIALARSSSCLPLPETGASPPAPTPLEKPS